MWSWGVNNFGKLAVFSTVYYSTPVSILGAKKTFCIVQAIQQHAMAIDYTGLIWTWGNSNNGQTGINLTTTTHSTPVSILGARKTFCSINTGGNLDSYGLDYKGQIWSWGYNNNGQLGINSSLNQSTPVSILGNKKTFCYMYGNGSYCMSIDYKGQVWGWGYNGFGQLGINSIVNQSTPVSVQGAKKTFCRIVIGQYYNIALDYNGNLWAWGLNNNGQLGDFTTQYKSTPILINI
jgi:alpha-tubulin suppressor-like RCC1 family protein